VAYLIDNLTAFTERQFVVVVIDSFDLIVSDVAVDAFKVASGRKFNTTV
jgi:hypothetical protein